MKICPKPLLIISSVDQLNRIPVITVLSNSKCCAIVNNYRVLTDELLCANGIEIIKPKVGRFYECDIIVSKTCCCVLKADIISWCSAKSLITKGG